MKLVKINKNIFRKYDIRGINDIDLNEDVAYTIGRSFGSYIKNKNQNKTIVGHDNRLNSSTLYTALMKGIVESGIDVISLGLVTTPMYYFARKHFDLETGIMITASHNPKEYNGFKIAFDKIGNAYGEKINEFRDYTNNLDFNEGNGFIEEYDIKKDYLKLIKDRIDLGDKKIKVVVDCGNGTGSIIIKDILDMFNIEYKLLFCESDGSFPNHHPDPSIPENQKELSSKVKKYDYDLGIGIDGDADRVGIVDNKGNILSADIVMIYIYRYLNNFITNKKAIFDVKCSRSLIDDLDRLKYEKIMHKTGVSYMGRKIYEENAPFGGEFSGHLWFRDKFLGFDDGIYAGLRIIEILSKTKESISENLKDINKYYSTDELKVKVTDENKFKVVEKVKEYCLKNQYKICDIDGVRVEFPDGWALVRASNTGPDLTVRFEAKTKEILELIKDEFNILLNDITKNI